jgi:hypothetical protein
VRVSERTRTYRIWLNLRDRCNNPNNIRYDRYGGRGIKCCKRWNSYKLFLKDMKECPPGLSIERRDNNKGYNPKNCYWGNSRQQSRNTSRNIKLTFQGRTQVLGDWADELGIDRVTLQHRIYAGWSVSLALTAPVPYHGRRYKIKPQLKTEITINGKTLGVTDWARLVKTPSATIHGRLYRGWSDKEAVYGKKSL